MNRVTIKVLIAAAIFAGCNLLAPEDTSRQVNYEVKGSAKSVSLTISNATGGTEQIASANLPWYRNFKCEKGTFLYISAQNNTSSGNVTASIYVDNKLYRTSTSSGAYVIATASGSAE